MRLKADESFKGIALFEPDPELDDNPGYLEYYDHYDKQGNTYVPCAGENCPFCAANDNPSTRALTTWYFPEASDVKDQIKVFTMNYSTINDMTDEAEEEAGILGKTIRVKRLDDRGNYKVRVLSDKPLTKKHIADLLKRLEDLFKDGLEGLVLTQLKRQIERLKAISALDDDEDDDDDDEPKAKRATTKTRRGKAEEEEEDDDEEDDEEDEDDEEETTDEEEEDEEEEEEDDEEEEDEEEEEEEAEAVEIKAGVYEIIRIKEADETFDLQNDDGKVKMWLGDGVDVDYDEIKKGVSVTVDASQDDEGDWIITAISLKKPPRSRTTTARKTKTATARKTSTRKTSTRKQA
jgi:hypothetical protein